MNGSKAESLLSERILKRSRSCVADTVREVMEENSDAHMDAGVSSTTDDILEVREVAPPHRDVETVVTVETITEEGLSPSKTKNSQPATHRKSTDINQATKPAEKTPQKEVMKKIIIKRPLKNIQLQPVPKSPTKPELDKKSINMGATESPKLPVDSVTIPQPSSTVGPPETDSKKSPLKLNQTGEETTTSEGKKSIQKSPVNDEHIQESKKSPTKPTTPINPVFKIASAKEDENIQESKKSPTKPTTPIKPVFKIALVKEDEKIQESKKSPTKPTTPVKPVFEISSAKEDENIQEPNKSPAKPTTPIKPGFKIASAKEDDNIQECKTSTKPTTPKTPLSKKASSRENENMQEETKKSTRTTTTKTPVSKTVKEDENIQESKKSPTKLTTPQTPVFSVASVKEPPIKIILSKGTQDKKHKETYKVVSPAKEQLPESTTAVEESLPKPTPTIETIEQVPPVQSSESLPIETDTSKLEDDAKSSISSMDVDVEASNDSQMETNSDTSEKEHNRSISREMRSLLNSAKESKIISECTQLTSKTRKSRTPLDTSVTGLNEADKISTRRVSDHSQKSTGSEVSEKNPQKRSMRSQNPEFASKVKTFLNSVTGKPQKDVEASEEDLDNSKNKNETETPSLPKKKKTEGKDEQVHQPESKTGVKIKSDLYCWRCHYAVEPAPNEKVHEPTHCSVCPRSYHFKCLSGVERSKIVENAQKNWVCPECMSILQAENSETRSPAMKKISLGMLCDLLKYALQRMMDLNGVDPFMHSVDKTMFPDYDKYVVHPMNLTLMKQHIAEGMYGSTEAFLSDAQWILHNSIIFNTLQSKLTGAARGLVRSCRAEMGEIEACPECYAAAHARRPTWFTDVCSTPHILLWAKLKGFPYWPAKGMTVNSSGLVDVRFFGAHDRAWVPARDCFLYSEKDPNNFRTKRQDILDSMQEAEQHIRNISRKYGKFVYPPFKTQFDPSKLGEQIKLMIPSFEGEVRSPVKDKASHNSLNSPASAKNISRSNSKSSKGSMHDGEASDSEESSLPSRKMSTSTNAESNKEEESPPEKEKSEEKEKNVKSTEPQSKDAQTSRKRRRSELEEAVITIMDTSGLATREKRRKLQEQVKTEDKKTDIKETNKNKDVKSEQDKGKAKDAATPQAKGKTAEATPPPSSNEKGKKIKVISIAKVMKTAKPPPIKVKFFRDKDKDRTALKVKNKSEQSEKSGSVDTDKDTPQESKKSEKRINSKSNKSLNVSNAEQSVTPSNSSDNSTVQKDKPKENEVANKSKTENNSKSTPSSSSDSPKKCSDRIQFDDDTSLAVIARETKTNSNEPTGLPTISNVRSLSTAKNNASKPKEGVKTAEAVVEAPSESSIFKPTSTENARNMKEAVDKLQKLRSETDTPMIGRVGVRAFARMTSPPAPPAPDTSSGENDVEVEIKAEPMELDDPARHMEKMDLMNAFKLRPVNQALREVRINKVVVTPMTRMVAPAPPVPVPIAPAPAPAPTPSVITAVPAANKTELRPRAKKTFPQPKKDDGRSELNCKNSMVYIPIQPPMTQAPGAPIRIARPVNGQPGMPTVSRIVPANSTKSVNSTATSTSVVCATSTSACPIPTVGPTTVHTVPLITTVNGQWTFSLQPVMSVGGVDSATPPPLLNGLPDRSAPSLVSIAPAPSSASNMVPTTPGAVNASSTTPAILPATLPATVPNLATPVIAQSVKTSSDSNAPGEPPRLQQRPTLMNPFDANASVSCFPPPSSVGPLTARLNQNAVKMTDFFRTLLEDCMEKLDEPLPQLTRLKLQLEQCNWKHQQQVEEIKHNYELTMAEMRSSFEKEKVRVVCEARRAAAAELETAVKLAKSKQWCANCSQEAQFYCCWNTSYCDYPCQRAHWSQHFAVCTQQRSQDGSDNANSPDRRLQAAPDNLPKTTAAPALTAATKLAPSRVYSEQPNVPQKTSIIVSMVEDNSGNQTMKCVGTYKPPAAAQNSPIILNKQHAEETAKKVVTSGGYLIVGASNSAPNSTIVNPPRRSNAIQYIS